MNLIVQRNLFPIFALFSTVLFISLGIWQIQRHDQKVRLISEIESQMMLSSMNFDNRVKEDSVVYRKYLFKGTFLNQYYYIYGSNFESQKNGYFVATPILLEGGDTILVIRGWSQFPDSIIQDDYEVFEGTIIRNSTNKYAPLANFTKNIYYSFDLQQIPNNLNLERQYFIIQTQPTTDLASLNISKFTHIYNRHIAYIITWFTLAFFTFIMSVIYLKKKE